MGFIEYHRAVKPLMVISRLARITSPSVCVLEKQPEKSRPLNGSLQCM